MSHANNSNRLGFGLSCAILGVFFSMAATAQTTGAAEEVWIGTPFSTTLHKKSECGTTEYSCPFPWKHWTEYGGDWSIDLRKEASSSVYLYAAPQHTRDSVTAKVERVSEACANGNQGGKVVRVGVYVNGKSIGTIAYSHVVTSLKKDDKIDRWGGKIGTLFSTTVKNDQCWTGPHLHLEVSSKKGYSCYNKGLLPSAKFSEKDFIGFVSGARASSRKKSCP
jgi:hypothetical protein